MEMILQACDGFAELYGTADVIVHSYCLSYLWKVRESKLLAAHLLLFEKCSPGRHRVLMRNV